MALRARAAAVTVGHEPGCPSPSARSAVTAAADTGRPVTATATPHFQWGDRGDGLTRVWMPLRG
ncbi:hypothetical protein [Streptomyces carpinensis]|uniref:hypothetical protein n=1 Tax=Streptomyces carpinensis TaxID=66369 RepID=UPI000A3D2BBF|nr:hypothetical protein [Streptomyces carpinensis]